MGNAGFYFWKTAGDSYFLKQSAMAKGQQSKVKG